jgi:nucleotide-binding universal stress UspA family protein
MKTATPELESSLAAPPQPLHVKKILVPLDFSGPSKKAFEYALRFAQQFGSEIVLIHVLDPRADVNGACEIPPRPGDQLSVAEKNLQAMANSSCPSGTLYITSSVRAGVASAEIVAAAKEFDVDLIITATHGLSGWKHFGMGNTAERVSRAASCPVLIVREKEHEFI